jgi:hypothetical protein
MAGLSEADGFLEDTILAPCGERVDKALLSELKFQEFQAGESSFEPFRPVYVRFQPGQGVLPLAAATRQKDPRTTSQLDVSLPMSGAPSRGTIAGANPIRPMGTTASPRRVSRDDRGLAMTGDGLADDRAARSLPGALEGRVSPDEGGRVSPEKAPCLSTQTSWRQAHGS